MIQKEVARQQEGRVPADHSPRKLSRLAKSIVYPYREYTTFPWKMDLAIPVMEIGAKDKPAASSFLLRIKSIHNKTDIWLINILV